MWITVDGIVTAATAVGALVTGVKLKFTPWRDRRQGAVLQENGRGKTTDCGGQVGDADKETPVPGTVAILIVALSDEDTAVRLYVARTLGRLGRQATAAAPALRRALWDRVPVVSRAAREALEKIVS